MWYSLLESLLKQNKYISANHIQNLDADSFYRYCAWNEIDVDLEGFIKLELD